MLKSQLTEIDELVGDIKAGLEASPFNSGGNSESCVGRRERSNKRLTTTALCHKLDVHALAGRVDGHVGPPAAVRADRLAVVGRTVVDADVIERTTAQQTV